MSRQPTGADMGNEQKLKVERRPSLSNRSGLEAIKTLTSEEIRMARGVAERIAASVGFYVRKD